MAPLEYQEDPALSLSSFWSHSFSSIQAIEKSMWPTFTEVGRRICLVAMRRGYRPIMNQRSPTQISTVHLKTKTRAQPLW
jgi:hypothetical protein